jgi:hypothetical protein
MSGNQIESAKRNRRLNQEAAVQLSGALADP